MKSRPRDKRAEPPSGGSAVAVSEPVTAPLAAESANGSSGPNGHVSEPAAPVAPARSNRTPGNANRPSRRFGLMDVVWFIPRLLLRAFFPKLLDRYVMGELLGPLFFGWTLFIVLFVFSVNLFKLAQLAARGAAFDVVGEMLGLRVVLASVYCLPMAMLLAGLLAFGRLSGDSEVVAMQASGIPNLRIIRNAFLLGLLLSIAGIAINEYVIPPAGRRLQTLEDGVKKALKGKILDDLADQKAFIIQDYDGGKLSRVIIAKRFEASEPPRPALMRGVTYMQYEKGEVQMLVEADRAEWIGDDKDHPGRQWWRFIEAKTQLMDRVTPGKKVVWESSDMKFYLNKPVQQVQAEQKDADEMTYRELKRYIQDIRSHGAGGWAGGKVEKQRRVIRELEVDLERKLAVPFAALVFALIGAPLGIRKQRSTTGVGIGLSILVIITYYIGMSFLSVMGQNGQLGPMEAAWGCNAAGLLVGLFLTWRSSR